MLQELNLKAGNGVSFMIAILNR